MKTVIEPIINHSLTFVDEVPATYEADGVKAHYECSVCGELFSDAEGKNEVTAEDLVIPILAPTEPETQTIENCNTRARRASHFI